MLAYNYQIIVYVNWIAKRTSTFNFACENKAMEDKEQWKTER